MTGAAGGGADALLVFGGQSIEQPDMLTLLPLQHDEHVRSLIALRTSCSSFRVGQPMPSHAIPVLAQGHLLRADTARTCLGRPVKAKLIKWPATSTTLSSCAYCCQADSSMSSVGQSAGGGSGGASAAVVRHRGGLCAGAPGGRADGRRGPGGDRGADGGRAADGARPEDLHARAAEPALPGGSAKPQSTCLRPLSCISFAQSGGKCPWRRFELLP